MAEVPSAHPLRELIALMVHDLSNPLQSLSMLLELAQDDVAPGTEAHERLVEASRAAVAMRNLIRGLGDFNRSAKGGKPAPANRLVASTLKALERRFARQGIELADRTTQLTDADVPADFQILFLTLILAVLGAEQTPGSKLSVTISTPVSTSLRVEMSATDATGARSPWPLSQPHLNQAAELAHELELGFETSAGQATITLQ